MRRIAFFCAVAVALSLITPVIGDSVDRCLWSCYMMNPEHNAVVAQACGVSAEKIEKPLWVKTLAPDQIETYGRSVQAPAVYDDGFVYYGRCDEMAHSQYLSKLIKANANTGETVWEFVIDNPVIRSGQPKAEVFMSGLCASPLIVDGKIYFASVGGQLYCLDAQTGEQIWNYKYPYQKYGLNDGIKKLLKIPTTKGVSTYLMVFPYMRSSPVEVNGTVYFAVNMSPNIIDVDDSNQNMLTMYDGKVAECLERHPEYYDKYFYGKAKYDVYSFSPETNEFKIVVSTQADFLEKLGKGRYGMKVPPDDFAMHSNLTASGNKLLINTTIELICFDLKTKKQLWTLAGNSTHPFFSTPSISNGIVSYGGPQQEFYQLKLESGGLEWHSKPKWNIRNSSTPLLIGTKLFIPGRYGNLTCIDTKKDEILWNYETGSKVSIYSSPVCDNGKLWFGSYDKNLYCLEAETGNLVKKIKLDGEIIAPPVIADKKLFIGTEAGTFYCFGESTEAKPKTTSTIADGDNSWTTFMGNNEHTGIVPASVGPKTDQVEVHWAYECGFRVIPSIIIANNLAFCGSQDNNVHAVHLDTALEAWRYNCGDKCNKDKHIVSDSLKEGGVNSTPVYADGKLYFGIICYKLVCIDATNGSKVWEYDDPDNDEHFDSPVLLYKDKIYATSFERLYCLDAKTGKKLWITSVWNNKLSPPMIADGKLYIAALTRLMCLNPDTGEPAVKDGFVHDGKTINFACPAYKDGKVYFGTDDSDFFCFDAKTGKEVWRSRDQRAITCPVVGDDKIYFGDIFNGITCLDRNTGKDLWKFKTGGQVAGAPVLCGEKLYFGSADGCMYCIETKYGHQVWKYDSHEGMKSNTGDHFFMSSPVIVGGKIYIGNVDGRVFCFGDVRKGLILDKVKVTVPAKYVLTNEKIKLTATAYAKDGSVMQAKPVWSCEPKELGTIDQDGVFWAGPKSGTVTVRATVDKIYDQVRVDIKDLKDLVVNVSVEPRSLKLYTNQQQQIKATAFDGAGNVIEGVSFEWRVEPTTIGTIENGLFTALKSGKGKVTAVIGSRSAVTQVLVVKPTRIAIDPQTAVVTAGGTQQFKVTVWDDLDDKIENPVPTWTVEPQTLGTINADGLFVAGARAGEGRVVANFEGLEAIAPVTVNPPPSGKIEVSPLALDFGTLDFDASKTMKITLSNSGDAAITAEITSDSEWLKVSPAKADIEASANKVLDVKVDVTGKAPGTQLSGKVLVKWEGGNAEIAVKAKVSLPKDCVTADVKNIVADVSFNGTGSYFLELKTAPGKDLTISIESSNPRVSPDPASIKVNGTTEKIRLNIDTSGVNVGEKIEGSLTISAGEFCKTLEIPFSFTVKKAEIVILLQIGNKTAKIDGKETTLSVPPQIISGNTMVPLRFIGEAFGCKVDWNGNEKKITITRGSFEMMLWLGKTTAKVNGQDKVMKAPPASINGSTLVPLRFIAEAFGATVNFNSATQEITINWLPN